MVEGQSRYFTAADGLRLHARDYDPGPTSALPVVCLPGLSRTAEDFDRLAGVLANAAPARRVVALDYRGRGLSGWDADPKRYDMTVESGDISTVLNAMGITRAIFVGTSRGGLHTMIKAAVQPDVLAGAVLNDIGPVVEVAGLRRIKGYIGKIAPPKTWDEAVEALKTISDGRFVLSDADWLTYAHLTFDGRNGALSGRYDPGLTVNLEALDFDKLPSLWPQFEALQPVPLMIIRGANSDLLSAETAGEMAQRHPDARLLTVPDQGHAPLLIDRPTLDEIVDFARHCDAWAAERVDRSAAQ